MDKNNTEVVRAGIQNIMRTLASSGVNLNITEGQILLISQGAAALIDVINDAAVKKALAAGQAGADSITTVEQANDLLKAAADAEAKR